MIQGDPDRWCLQDTLRTAGAASLVLGVVLFPLVGGDNQDKDPLASLAVHELVYNRLLLLSVVLAALGLLVLLVSLFVPRDEL